MRESFPVALSEGENRARMIVRIHVESNIPRSFSERSRIYADAGKPSDIPLQAFDASRLRFEGMYRHTWKQVGARDCELSDVCPNINYSLRHYPLALKGKHHTVRGEGKFRPRQKCVPCRWVREKKLNIVQHGRSPTED